MKKFLNMKAATLSDLTAEIADNAASDLAVPIVPRLNEFRAGALSQLSHAPGPSNVAHRDVFLPTLACLFKNTDS